MSNGIKAKSVGGRPTDYDPAHCERIIELMSEGISITAAAAAMGYHRDTLYEWARVHPEFSDALKIARGKRVLRLELELLDATDGPSVTARIFALKNADPKEWLEKQHHQLEVRTHEDLVMEIAKEKRPELLARREDHSDGLKDAT